jgi:Bacterial transglutaminase-like N-terminal region
MTTLNGRHMTVYRYRRPVRFGDNRLMLRPRDTALHQGVDIALSLNEAELGHDLCYELGELAPLPRISLRTICSVLATSRRSRGGCARSRGGRACAAASPLREALIAYISRNNDNDCC